MIYSVFTVAQTPEIPVKVIVQPGSDMNDHMVKLIESEFLTELRKKTNVTTTAQVPLYTIIAHVVEIKSIEGNVLGLVLSTVLTRRIGEASSNEKENRKEYFTSGTYTLGVEQQNIRNTCAELVANFDVTFFEIDRNGRH